MSATCRIPGCDGYTHADGGCVADIAELSVGDHSHLFVEHVHYDGEAPHIVLYGDFAEKSERMTSPAAVRALADRYRAFAERVELAADLLTPAAAPAGAGVARIVAAGRRALTVREVAA